MFGQSQEARSSAFPAKGMALRASGSIPVQEAVSEVQRLLAGALPARSLLEEYRPQDAWFLRSEYIGDIHGINHEARVLIWQEILARLLLKDGITLNQEALRWAAATHDTQRLTDGTDWKHGERAAAWVEREFSEKVNAETLSTVVYLDLWHVPPDRSAPEITAELAVFKDADGLDRVRINDLDPRHLRCDYSRQLLQYLAQALFDRSEALYESGKAGLFDCALAAAVELGLLLAE